MIIHTLDKEVTLIIPTVINANKSMIESKGEYFIAMSRILEQITTLTKFEIEEMSVQDVIYVIAFFRGLYWNNIPIFEDSEKNEAFAVEVPRAKANYEEEIFIIDGVEFSNKIIMKNAIEAEKKVMRDMHPEVLPNMVISSCCTKGLSKGWQIIENLKSTPILRGAKLSLIDSISNYGKVCLLLNSENDRPISLETAKDPNTPKEFPFRSSLLFSF